MKSRDVKFDLPTSRASGLEALQIKRKKKGSNFSRLEFGPLVCCVSEISGSIGKKIAHKWALRGALRKIKLDRCFTRLLTRFLPVNPMCRCTSLLEEIGPICPDSTHFNQSSLADCE